MNFKITTQAWVTEFDQDTFVNGKLNNNHNEILTSIRFTNLDMTVAGWTTVGTAEIEVTLHDDDKVKENLIESLQEQKKTIMAQTQVKLNQIEEKIQSLLAITYEGEK